MVRFRGSVESTHAVAGSAVAAPEPEAAAAVGAGAGLDASREAEAASLFALFLDGFALMSGEMVESSGRGASTVATRLFLSRTPGRVGFRASSRPVRATPR